MSKNIIPLIFILLFTQLFFTRLCWADNEQLLNVKELKEAGEISSLESILAKLSGYDIRRLLEIELKRGVFQENSHRIRQQYIYEIEYINNKGIVMELEVDALTAQVLHSEREH